MIAVYNQWTMFGLVRQVLPHGLILVHSICLLYLSLLSSMALSYLTSLLKGTNTPFNLSGLSPVEFFLLVDGTVTIFFGLIIKLICRHRSSTNFKAVFINLVKLLWTLLLCHHCKSRCGVRTSNSTLPWRHPALGSWMHSFLPPTSVL